MSRRAGQLTTRQAAVGLLLTVLLLGAIIGGLSRLLVPAPDERVGESEAGPPEPCPAPVQPGRSPIAVGTPDLLDCPDTYDGATVRYEGEVIGMVLHRGDRAWVQLNDDAYALQAGPLPEHRTPLGGNSGTAVSIPEHTVEAIREVGGFRAAGTRLSVVGTYLRADPGDGGAPAIRADLVDVVDPGHRISHPVHVPRAVAAGVLSAVTAAAALAVEARRRRQLR